MYKMQHFGVSKTCLKADNVKLPHTKNIEAYFPPTFKYIAKEEKEREKWKITFLKVLCKQVGSSVE